MYLQGDYVPLLPSFSAALTAHGKVCLHRWNTDTQNRFSFRQLPGVGNIALSLSFPTEDYADYAKWNTDEVLNVNIFLPHNIEEFLGSLVAMTNIGLKNCDLI